MQVSPQKKIACRKPPAIAQFAPIILLATSVIIKTAVFLTLFSNVEPSDIQFNFGGYVQSIFDGMGFVSNCNGDKCWHSMRMPVLPYYLAMCFYLGPKWLMVFIKSSVLTVLIYISWNKLRKSHTGTLYIWDFAILFVILNPFSIKHAATPHYEEFFISEIMILCGLLWALLAKKSKYIIFIVSLSLFAYLIKVNFIAAYIFSILILLTLVIKKIHAPILSVAICTICIFISVGWAVHNYNHGRLTFGTSYDGENLYRATHPQARLLYPQVALDRLIDSERVCIEGDSLKIIRTNASGSMSFSDEWAWNDYYKKEAVINFLSYPVDNALYLAKKIFYIFFGIFPVLRIKAECGIEIHSDFYHASYGILLVVYRLLFLLSLYKIFTDTRKKMQWQLMFSIYLLALLLPLMVGWAWERQLTPMLNFVIACACGIAYQTNHSNKQ